MAGGVGGTAEVRVETQKYRGKHCQPTGKVGKWANLVGKKCELLSN